MSTDPPQGPLPRSAWYTLGLLLAIYVVNHIDRQVMYILIEPVRVDLELSDSQMGWLVGAGFAIFYTLAGVPIARWADRGNRRNIIAIALAIWSVMTVASGLARNFAQLMAARVGVGVGEAGCTPPAHSIISDIFPLERRATAISIYSLGVPIGGLFGMAFGGILAQELGWRIAFYVVGFPGIALAVITLLTMREPKRGAQDVGATAEVESLPSTLRFMFALSSIRHMLAATSIQTLGLAAAGAWHTSFLLRVHDYTLAEAGVRLGLISGVAGGSAVYLAGKAADRLGSRDLRWHIWLPASGALLSIPFSALAYSTASGALALAMIALATLGNHVYSGLSHAVLQGLAKPRMRALTSAIALFAMNIVGVGLGPVAAGTLSDALGGEAQLRYALLYLIVGCMAWSSVHYLLAARSYREDLDAKYR